jgi:hypothetical protein
MGRPFAEVVGPLFWTAGNMMKGGDGVMLPGGHCNDFVRAFQSAAIGSVAPAAAIVGGVRLKKDRQ